MAKHDVTRRGFMAAAVGAAVSAAIPTAAQAAPRMWSNAVDVHGAALRAAYMAELAGFAETLRPRFESGELRALREGDDTRIEGAEGWGPECYKNESPQWTVEALASAHFGLEVVRTDMGRYEQFDGNGTVARLILAVSPHRETVGDGWRHECYAAADAVMWDVIAYAREHRWYTPSPDECEDPLVSLAREPSPTC